MLRFPSAVLGVATVAMTAMLGTRLAGRRAGLAAAALLTVMPLHLYYSREGRMYALFALVLLAWVMALIRARERNTLGSWTMYTVLGAAALYTHYYAGFTVLAVVGATAVLELRHEITTRTCRWLIATIGIGVLFAPWLPTFRYQLNNDPLAWLDSPGFSGWVRLPVEFFAGFVEYSMIDPSMNQYVENLFKANVILIPLAVLLLFGSRHLRTVADRTPDAAFAAAVVGAAFFGTLLLAFVASQFRTLFFVRYFVGILPFLAILIGAALARMRPMTVIAFGALFASAALHTALTIDETWRPAFRDATDQIEQDQPDDVIVVFVDLNLSEPGSGDFATTSTRRTTRSSTTAPFATGNSQHSWTILRSQHRERGYFRPGQHRSPSMHHPGSSPPSRSNTTPGSFTATSRSRSRHWTGRTDDHHHRLDLRRSARLQRGRQPA